MAARKACAQGGGGRQGCDPAGARPSSEWSGAARPACMAGLRPPGPQRAASNHITPPFFNGAHILHPGHEQVEGEEAGERAHLLLEPAVDVLKGWGGGAGFVGGVVSARACWRRGGVCSLRGGCPAANARHWLVATATTVAATLRRVPSLPGGGGAGALRGRGGQRPAAAPTPDAGDCGAVQLHPQSPPLLVQQLMGPCVLGDGCRGGSRDGCGCGCGSRGGKATQERQGQWLQGRRRAPRPAGKRTAAATRTVRVSRQHHRPGPRHVHGSQHLVPLSLVAVPGSSQRVGGVKTPEEGGAREGGARLSVGQRPVAARRRGRVAGALPCCAPPRPAPPCPAHHASGFITTPNLPRARYLQRGRGGPPRVGLMSTGCWGERPPHRSRGSPTVLHRAVLHRSVTGPPPPPPRDSHARHLGALLPRPARVCGGAERGAASGRAGKGRGGGANVKR